MHPVIHQYKLRLTNLSQANRSLKLNKLAKRKDLDLTDAAFLNKLSTSEILQRIIAGKSVSIIRGLSARDEATNTLDRRLNNIYHEVNTIYEETGAYDLLLGYPFVEGKFLDGSNARCPVVLFPLKLVRNFQGSPRWKLEVPKGAEPVLNKTFFLAYEKYMQVRLSKEFWEWEPEHHKDIQSFLNALYKHLRAHELEVHFNSDLFQFKPEHFPPKNAAQLEQLPLGRLRFLPHAVMGIFPQSDSALVQDYEILERDAEGFGIDEYLRIQPETSGGKYIKEDQRYFVAQVDQSQEESLLKVKNGQSVVLHGPPGTGKSQVILNLIADAMASGKKVLVCSQKRAALDVVYQRLAEIGLGRFAALVHDFRSDRSKIFAHIREQIDEIDQFKEGQRDLGLDKWMRDFRRDSRKLDEFNNIFDGLHKGLSEVGRFGLAPHQMYLMADAGLPGYSLREIAVQFTYDTWSGFRDKLSAILDYREFFHPEHPWRDRLSFHRQSFSFQSEIREMLSAMAGDIQALHESWQQLQPLHEEVQTAEDIRLALTDFEAYTSLLTTASAGSDLAAMVGDDLKMAFVRRKLDSFGKAFSAMEKFQLLDRFPLHLHADLKERFEAYEKGKGLGGRYLSGKWLRGWWYIRRIIQKEGRKFKKKEIKTLKSELQVLNRLMEHMKELNDYPFFEDMPLMSSPADMEAWRQRKLKNLELVKHYRADKTFPSLRPRPDGTVFDHEHWEAAGRLAEQLRGYQTLVETTSKRWSRWLHPNQIKQLQVAMQDDTAAYRYAAALSRSFEEGFEDLRALDEILHGLTPVEQNALDALESPVGGPDAPEAWDLLKRVENSMLLAWIEITEAEQPVLAEVSSRNMPRKQQDFRQLVRERQQTVVQLIIRKLKDEIVDNISYNRLKNPVTYREIAHQVRKQRRLWSVRKLVREFWDEGLNRLMPCWMASPESVAAIFPMVRDYFDLVIFDEASQCYVERALPVMLRGKHCVIAGDDKQLPPFDLYNVKVDEDEGAFFENEMALEVESILDLSRNVFAECKLSWHYRSKEEELINFSNHAFYEGRLNIIPPATHDPLSHPPIEFISVDGLWEKNRNQAEAERVITLVEELVQHPRKPTIGIVTFNYHQKELIRNLLDQRLQELSKEGKSELLALLNEALEREEGEERQGIFVKNIENVQGDERDVIIFSIGYARNAAGRLVTHFGLLNQKGGENRLNVAITRSKKKEYVICSFDPSELKVEDAKHDGPRMFKRYLQYAQALSNGQPELADKVLRQLGKEREDDATGDALTPLPADAAQVLLADRLQALLEPLVVAKGLNLRRSVGDTRFKVDLAICDADGRFLLGIECEGPSYFSGKSSKEREVYRRELLEQRGWKMMMVWARNFFLDPKGTVDALVEAACDSITPAPEK